MTLTTDPLLALGKAIAIIGQALMALAAVVLVIAIPFLVIFRTDILAQMQSELPNDAVTFPTLAIVGLLLLMLAIVALVWSFLRNLRRIIGTVADGDPFIPVNADRLTGMAWMMLAVQVLTIPAAGLGLLIAQALGKFESVKISLEGDFDVSGIVLVIILFILARVFRKGTQMRNDLEGIV